MAQKLQRNKKVVSIILAVCLVIQLLLLTELGNLSEDLKAQPAKVTQLRTDTVTTLMTDTVRQQQRTMLNAIRQGWVQYVQSHPEEMLILKDEKGLTLYGNNTSTKRIAFNPATMNKVKTPSNYYDLKSNTTGELIASNVRPIWNTEVVKRILDIIATPVRAFGSTGDVIIFDSYTGEMIIDNSEDCKDTPEVLAKDGKRYITLDYKHPNNANPTASQRVINNEFMWRKDTDRNSGQVYYFSEKTDFGKDANDFAKYPLGNYNREFQEKIILPYETVGVDGENMQITIVLGSQEQEIVAPYKDVLMSYNTIINNLQADSMKITLFPYISIFVSFIVILICMFMITLYSHILKKKNTNTIQRE